MIRFNGRFGLKIPCMLLVAMILMGAGVGWACCWLCVGKSVWWCGEVGYNFGKIGVVGPLFVW